MFPIHPLFYHPYESFGGGHVAYLTIIWGGLSLFIIDMMNPVHLVHPHLLDLVVSLNIEWESITELHIPPCELFHG